MQNFYATLYEKNPSTLGEDSMNIFLNGVNNKKLSFEQKKNLDKEPSRVELSEALKSFKKNKTPGNDGLTSEFYLAFWHLLACLDFSPVHGLLCISQKQALIVLLEKKDKQTVY